MTELTPTPPAASPSASASTSAPKSAEPTKKEENFFVFLLKLAVIVLVFRSFFMSPFNIPSESMLPRLLVGDYLLAQKWSYGYSRHSLPLGLPLIPGRIFASEPKRGDVVIFKAPPLDDIDYIKRVIGLPGDTVQMVDGMLYLNGAPVKQERMADFIVAASPNTRCAAFEFEVRSGNGAMECHYPRYRETLPGGRSYEVLDLGLSPADNTVPVIVPESMMFLLGDNRDNSQDSRFPAQAGGGIGLVPQDNLVGKAGIMMWSTDGSSSWVKPWTWFTAARWNRIGGTF